MFKWLRGTFPDLTPAQLVAGIPIIAELAHSFGVFTMSAAQQASLGKAVTWAGVLILGDAGLRVGRNIHQGLKARALSQPNVLGETLHEPAFTAGDLAGRTGTPVTEHRAGLKDD